LPLSGLLLARAGGDPSRELTRGRKRFRGYTSNMLGLCFAGGGGHWGERGRLTVRGAGTTAAKVAGVWGLGWGVALLGLPALAPPQDKGSCKLPDPSREGLGHTQTFPLTCASCAIHSPSRVVTAESSSEGEGPSWVGRQAQACASKGLEGRVGGRLGVLSLAKAAGAHVCDHHRWGPRERVIIRSRERRWK